MLHLYTITAPERVICTISLVTNREKSSSDRETRGRGDVYSSSATTEASAKKKSVSVVMIAAGAVFAWIASSRTAVVVEEPRVNGMARILSRATAPESM